MCQILITTLIVSLVMSCEAIRVFMKSHTWMYWMFLALTIFTICFLFCNHKLVTKVPYNYIIVFAFTIFNSYLISGICTFQDPLNVLIAALMTLGMFSGLSLLSFCTKFDVNFLTGLVSSLITLLLFLMVLVIVFSEKIILICGCAGILAILSVFIIYDTQAIANHSKYQLSYDDYLVAAILLYTDILTIFMYLLVIMSILRR